MPYSVKGLNCINEGMDLLMLEVLFKLDSMVEDLLCGAPSGCESSLFFNTYPFSLALKLFKMTVSMTLLERLMRLIVL